MKSYVILGQQKYLQKFNVTIAFLKGQQNWRFLKQLPKVHHVFSFASCKLLHIAQHSEKLNSVWHTS